MELPPPGHFLFTSESVNAGHPDKLCDQISDAILDACLAQDPKSRVACETCTKTGMVIVFGEITTKAKVNYEEVVRQTVKDIGYDSEAVGLDYKSMEVVVALEDQSADIYQCLHMEEKLEEMGAGDQGHMFGYACDETEELMPLSHVLATKLGKKLTQVREEGECPFFRPDGKTQVTVEYRKDETGTPIPCRVHTIVISTQHDDCTSNETLREALMEKVVKKVIPPEYIDEKTIFHLNPSGRFVIGGPHGDAGLTGRKIIIDTYGGWAPHGGGAFSGKDPSKVDRSAAYAARWAAKSLVSNGLCRRCLVQLSYSIGINHPLSLFVDSFNTAKNGLDDADLLKILHQEFDFRPGVIIKSLNLRAPQYKKLAAFGHFGRSAEKYLWEKPVDLSQYKKGMAKVEEGKKAIA